MSHKHILITGGSLQASSRGIVGLVLGTITSIKSANPDVSFTVISSRCSYDQQTNIEIQTDDGICVKEFLVRGRHFPSLLAKAFLLSALPNNLRKNLITPNTVIGAYIQADAVISLSAGDSFSDIYGFRQFLPHYLFDFMALILKRPLIIFPQTIGPFKNFFAKILARFSLTRAKLVFTREEFSTQTVMKLCANRARNIEKVDIAFLMMPAEKEKPRSLNARTKVGLNISGFMTFSAIAKRLMNNVDYIEFMNDVIKTFVDKYNADILLIPHDYESINSNDDLRACEVLYNTLNNTYHERVCIVREHLSAPQLKALIGECDFFVGARLHACIAALSMEVPTVPIAYSYKFIGILNKVGLNKIICDPRQDSIESMISKIELAYQDREAIHAHLGKKLPEIKATALSCGTILRDELFLL